MSNLKNKVLKILKEDEDTKRVEEADYVELFNKIGEKKIVEKTLNVMPDFKVHELNKGFYYVFIKKSVFDVFKTLNKFLLFKQIGVFFNFKKLVFYITDEEDLIITLEKGVVNEEHRYNTSDLWKNILELVKSVERKLEKEIILKKV